MGIKYKKDYKDIIKELTEAVIKLEKCYEFAGMNFNDWQQLNNKQQKELIKTLADDIFYALGNNPRLKIGSGTATYDNKKQIIKVKDKANNFLKIIHLM
ncbi:MAG: hypothetical protein ACOCRZ_00740 [Halothermotrichaceae bacterium]